jgi:hypothetical protein
MRFGERSRADEEDSVVAFCQSKEEQNGEGVGPAQQRTEEEEGGWGGGAGERWVGFEATAPCGAWREQGDRPAERHATGAAARQGILQGWCFGMGRRRWHMGRGWLSGR